MTAKLLNLAIGLWRSFAGSPSNALVPSVGGVLAMTDEPSREPARDPQDLERLLISRQWEGDIYGIAALFEPNAVVDSGERRLTLGREAIRALFADITATGRKFVAGKSVPACYQRRFWHSRQPAFPMAP
ncbi:hypothetical protein [Mesorhizobium sp. AA22]|uniref:hypothetical protein n=1 Tax=Mesorhizobium sp. AA22 TaxID=1854057 RepID=UPI001FEFBF7A|nr:hypothetical protein [Mesorhizobium sp. AA22]